MVTKLQIARAAVVVPSDTIVIPNIANENGKNNRGCLLYIGNGGDLKIKTEGGDIVTFVNIADGSYLPVSTLQVFLTGTTCADILALW